MVLDIMHIASCPINSLPQAVTGALLGGAVTAMQQGMHMPAIQRGAVTWGGFTYLYAVTTCTVHGVRGGRPSLIDNGIAGGMIGAAGVFRGLISIPFVDIAPYSYTKDPRTLAIAAGVYGGIGMAFGLLGGKQL